MKIKDGVKLPKYTLMEKSDKLLEFNCDLCNKDKKSKNVALDFVNEKMICNGCYGKWKKDNNG